MTETTTKSPPLTIERATAIVRNLYGPDWNVYRVVGSEIEGVARATRGDDDWLFVINDGRIVSRC